MASENREPGKLPMRGNKNTFLFIFTFLAKRAPLMLAADLFYYSSKYSLVVLNSVWLLKRTASVVGGKGGAKGTLGGIDIPCPGALSLCAGGSGSKFALRCRLRSLRTGVLQRPGQDIPMAPG